MFARLRAGRRSSRRRACEAPRRLGGCAESRKRAFPAGPAHCCVPTAQITVVDGARPFPWSARCGRPQSIALARSSIPPPATVESADESTAQCTHGRDVLSLRWRLQNLCFRNQRCWLVPSSLKMCLGCAYGEKDAAGLSAERRGRSRAVRGHPPISRDKQGGQTFGGIIPTRWLMNWGPGWGGGVGGEGGCAVSASRAGPADHRRRPGEVARAR